MKDVTPAMPAVRRGGGETILLVEDEKGLRRAARRVLEKLGYVVIEAPDGAEALQILRAGHPHIALVFTDMVMPKLDGEGMIEIAQREGLHTRFLVTSGYTAPEVRGRIEKNADVEFLTKPWSISDLGAAVRSALDREPSPQGPEHGRHAA